jgi:hypothetical protein
VKEPAVRRTLALLVLTAATAAPATAALADDIGVPSCAGVHDVNAGPGGVSVGGVWLTPGGCLPPTST